MVEVTLAWWLAQQPSLVGVHVEELMCELVALEAETAEHTVPGTVQMDVAVRKFGVLLAVGYPYWWSSRKSTSVEIVDMLRWSSRVSQ